MSEDTGIATNELTLRQIVRGINYGLGARIYLWRLQHSRVLRQKLADALKRFTDLNPTRVSYPLIPREDGSMQADFIINKTKNGKPLYTFTLEFDIPPKVSIMGPWTGQKRIVIFTALEGDQQIDFKDFFGNRVVFIPSKFISVLKYIEEHDGELKLVL